MKAVIRMAKGGGAGRGVTSQGRSLRIGATTSAGIARLRNRTGGARTLAQRARGNRAGAGFPRVRNR